MPFRKKEFVRPDLKYHAATHQACAYWNGARENFGVWDGSGTAPSLVLQRYLRWCQQIEEQFFAKKLGMPDPEEADLPLVVRIAEFLQFIQTHEQPDGALLPSGRLSSIYGKCVAQLKPLAALYGETLPENFMLWDFRAWRDKVREEPSPSNFTWHPPGTPARLLKAWSRKYTNEARNNLLRFFRYLETRGLVPEGRTHHLEQLKQLRLKPKKHIKLSREQIHTTLQYTAPPVRALAELQMLLGARPSELLLMKPRYIVRNGNVWTFRPRRHKNLERGKRRRIPIVGRAQEILRPFLDGRDPDDYCFKPAEAVAWWKSAAGSALRVRERKTTLFPCEIKRREKEKQRRAAKPKACYNAHYDRHSYRLAIAHAIRKARQAGHEVPAWSPYELRHCSTTIVQRAVGIEKAQCHAGHEHARTTEIYSHEQERRRLATARKVQQTMEGRLDVSRPLPVKPR